MPYTHRSPYAPPSPPSPSHSPRTIVTNNHNVASHYTTDPNFRSKSTQICKFRLNCCQGFNLLRSFCYQKFNSHHKSSTPRLFTSSPPSLTFRTTTTPLLASNRRISPFNFTNHRFGLN